MSRCVFCKEEFPASLDRCPNCGAEMADPVRADHALEGELLDLIDGGNTIAAIQRHREATGSGLAASKAAVEAMIDSRLSRGLRPVEPSHGSEAAVPTPEEAFESELLGLLASGRKIEAIKRHRARTGAGLKQSRETVERLAAGHGIAAPRAGCLGMLLLVAGAAMTLRLLTHGLGLGV